MLHIMTLKVVILELTDEPSGRKSCNQNGKSSSRTDDEGDDEKYLQKMDAAPMFNELVLEYISDHVLLAAVYGNGLYICQGSSIYGECFLLGRSILFKKIPILGWIL